MQDTLSNNSIEFNQVQLSFTKGSGIFEKHFLNVLAKRTYYFDSNGKCTKSASDDFFDLDTKYYHPKGELMMADHELYPYKPYTDVIVKGNVQGINGLGQMNASVEVGEHKKFEISVFGKRLAYKDTTGKILFTKPEAIDIIPLRYDMAYGGFDSVAEKKLSPVPKEYVKAFPDVDWDYSSIYRYPRNPCGKGYIVENNNEAFENFELPNLEDPFIRLTPDNLIVRLPENWINQPVPIATDWVNMAWFPRIAYWGILPLFVRSAVKNELTEIQRKWADTDVLSEKPMEEKLNMRLANGAPPGLQYPYLAGNESIRLVNIHPQKRIFLLELPNDIPRIWVDGRNGKLKEANPVIHTVIIETEGNKLTIIWRGGAPALRPYHDEELKKMPFKVEWKK